jgi:hypothetical protein
MATDKKVTFQSAIDFIGMAVEQIKQGGTFNVELGPYASSVKVTRGSTAAAGTLQKALIIGGLAVGAVLLLVLLKD